MARIRERQSGRIFALEAYTPVGRGTLGGVVLTDERVSNEHACLKWKAGRWAIRDLGSTNGTWVNGQALAPGVDRELEAGNDLAFGDRSQLFEFEDAAAPEPMVVPSEGGEPCVIQDGIIAIPNSENALASIFRGADGTWTLEHSDRVVPLTHGAVFEVAGKRWRFSFPNEWKTTAKAKQLRLVRESEFYFDVSSDEEYVALRVQSDGESVAMGQLSAFYLLLTLARIRQRDRGTTPVAEAGWAHRDDLTRMLRCQEQQLNVWVHRVRSRFSTKGFLDYAAVIERRDGSGQMRIGVDRFSIRSGDLKS